MKTKYRVVQRGDFYAVQKWVEERHPNEGGTVPGYWELLMDGVYPETFSTQSDAEALLLHRERNDHDKDPEGWEAV